MPADTRPTDIQMTQSYLRSVGQDMMEDVRLHPTMTDILDTANGNANPKARHEIASVISNIQARKNKEKGLFLNEEGTKYGKKNGGGGGGQSGGGRGNYNKRGGNPNGGNHYNNNHRNKKQRGNSQNQNQQGRGDLRNTKCTLPNHGGHLWKECFLNFRNKSKYNHEAAVKMIARDGVPGWFKAEVEKTTAMRSNNDNRGNSSQAYYNSQGNHSYYQGGPPQQNYQYYQQQPPPHQPQASNYMQMPPAPQQLPRGPGRNGPPAAPSSNGQWVFQPNNS